MAKGSSSNLPAYTTVENLLKLIGVLVKNNKNEESIKALFGMGQTAYTNTKSALKTYDIIETDSLDFTPFGREIAYSRENNKKEEMLKIVKNYEPYELVLNSIITSRSDIKVTEIDTIKNLWGKAEFGSGDRNRNDGATLFMSIIAYTGLGKYIIGRGSNPTRIEWAEGIKDKINGLTQETPVIEPKLNANSQDKTTIEASVVDTVSVEYEQEENSPVTISTDERNDRLIKKSPNSINYPNITINIDMSDWSDEKIKIFFRYAYGKFEED